MTISDAQYQAWLAGDAKTRVVLIEATAYSGAAETTRYLANRPFVSLPSDTPANTVYDDVLIAAPGFSARLSELFTGASVPAWGDVEILNESGTRDAWLDDGWDGRALEMYFGDPSWPRNDFRSMLTGVTADVFALDRKRIALRIRDKSWMMNIPIQTSLIGGATANKDQPKPLCYGQCYDVDPVLLDASLHKYQVHDGAINDITDVRDNGLTVAFTKSLSDGTFTLAAAPAGHIIADVQGAKPGGNYLTKCADIVKEIITARTQLTTADIDTTNFTAFNTTCPQTLGIYIRDRTTVVPVIDQLVTSVGGFWTFSRDGLLQLGRLEAPAGTPVIELTVDDVRPNQIEVVRRQLPIATLRLGYRRNFTVQTDGLAGAVSEASRADFAAEYLVATATNAGVATKHKLAPSPDLLDTLIALQADASTEASRLATLRSVIRTVYRVGVYAAPFRVNLGQVVKLTYPRYGFAAGALAVVVGITEQPTKHRATLELWR